MTIQNTTNKVTVNGNGSATSFSFAPMVIFTDTDLTVTLVDTTGVETLLTEGTGTSNYAVVPVGSYPCSGTITYPASGTTKLASGQKLVMKPAVPLTQSMALTTQGPYDPSTQETAFDRLTVISQQIQEEVDRSVTLPIGVSGVSTQLPVPVANTVLAWAADALSLINVGIASIGTTVASAFSLTLFLLSTAAAWRTALGSTTVGDALFTTASAAAARTTLGLGTAAVAATGTSGATVPLLNGANAHSALNTFSLGITVTGAGVQLGAPTGGDKGAGTTNAAAGVYDNGTRILSPFASATEYAPADQTITSGGTLTLAHGFGIRPKHVVLTLINQTTQGGWTAGQEIDICQGTDASGARGYALRRDATNIVVQFGSDASPLLFVSTTGGVVTLTPANWKLRVRAYA